MSISAVQSGQSMYGADSTQKKSTQATESSSNRTVASDSVAISDAAKAMAKTASTTKALQGTYSGIPGIAPVSSWQDSYRPEALQGSNGLINHDFFRWAEGLRTDPSISNDDRNQRLSNFLDNDEQHLKWVAGDDFGVKFASTPDSELPEYNKKLLGYYKEAYKENGATTQQEIFDLLVNDPEGSEKVRKSMLNLHEKMKNDPRMAELMEILGVNLPA